MANREKRNEARKLRKEGWQLIDVAKELDVPYSTIRQWCRDIDLTDIQLSELESENPLAANAQKGANKLKQNALQQRLTYQVSGIEQAQHHRLLHIIGCILYWGEGAKNRQKLKFTNTDPDMLVLFARFLREELNVPDDKFVLHVLSHTDDINEWERIRQYWLEMLALPDTCKVMFTLKVGTNSRKARYANGICSINIYSTEIVQHIFGAIQAYVGFENPKWVE
jgi:hypothetical protein